MIGCRCLSLLYFLISFYNGPLVEFFRLVLNLKQDLYSFFVALLSKELWLPGFVAYLRCDSELPLSSVFVFTRCKS